MREFGWVKRLGLGLSMSVAVALAAGSAAAQDDAPASDDAAPPASDPPPAINLTGAPAIDLSTPAPQAPVDRKFRQHEGFYARVNVGLGSLLSVSADLPGGGELTSGGLTLNYDLLIGGSPAPGFTVGGGVLGGLQMSGDWEVEGSGAAIDGGDLVTLVIGPFADGFPDSKAGWHFGGLAGLARTAFDGPGGDSEDAFGIGGAFWAGHDIWVAPEWSVGGLLRLDALRTSKDDVTLTAVGLTLMFTVLYN